MFREEGDSSFRPRTRPRAAPTPRHEPRAAPVIDWQGLHTHLLDHPERYSRLCDLAFELGVSVDSLEALGWVWVSRDRELARWLPAIDWQRFRACWAVPERDANGKIIGMTTRYHPKGKAALKGSQRGLTFDPAGFAADDRPVYLPEGASDTAALLTIGLRAVGRPSNTGGVDHLAGLLKDVTAPVVIVGENDHGPGIEGARQTARKLAELLGREVSVQFPPADVKDVRAWLQAHPDAPDAPGADLVAALGPPEVFGPPPPCPPQSIPLINREQNGADTVGDSDLGTFLAGLPLPPPADACPRGGASMLHHTDDPSRCRAVRHACDCWHCGVCRRRLARHWAEHLALCLLTALANGRWLWALETTSAEFGRCQRRWLNRHGADWTALETGPGQLLVLLALPRYALPPDGAVPLDRDQASRRLVHWARTVRAGPEPFARQRSRPCRTSMRWALAQDLRSHTWRHEQGLGAREVETVLSVLDCQGISHGQPHHGPSLKLGRSLVWSVEFRAPPDPEARARLRAALAACEDPLPVTSLAAPVNPFDEGPP